MWIHKCTGKHYTATFWEFVADLIIEKAELTALIVIIEYPTTAHCSGLLRKAVHMFCVKLPGFISQYFIARVVADLGQGKAHIVGCDC